MIKSYKDLTVWRKSFKLALRIYRTTKQFPQEELYGLVSQVRRAAFSIPSNIAEGYARNSTADYKRFLRTAFASGAELETQLLIAKETGLLSSENFTYLDNLLAEVMKMLNTLIRKLKTNP
jgi:four helix bundle protein